MKIFGKTINFGKKEQSSNTFNNQSSSESSQSNNNEDLKNQKAQLEKQYNYKSVFETTTNQIELAFSYLQINNNMFLTIRDKQNGMINEKQLATLPETRDNIKQCLDERLSILTEAISNAQTIKELNQTIYKKDVNTLKKLNATSNKEIQDLNTLYNYNDPEFNKSVEGVSKAIDYYGINPGKVIKSTSNFQQATATTTNYIPRVQTSNTSNTHHTR